ncbi:MAG: hypothetical protein JSW54_00025 [Fidelibacterota bacterium]|nr:MAG: hypothetical protein JSW54_00025 [Candidatus Neomarinimicrobiota bacterium]
MTARIGLLFLLAALVPVAGQTSNERQTESISDSLLFVPLALFPPWTAPAAMRAAPEPDSLVFTPPSIQIADKSFFRGQRRIGLGMVILFSALSYYFHQEAEAAYQAYRTSGNPAELEDLFNETQRLDQQAGWCFLGAETGLLLVAFSVILSQ